MLFHQNCYLLYRKTAICLIGFYSPILEFGPFSKVFRINDYLYIYIFIILNNLHNIFKKSNSWENKVTIGLICANQEWNIKISMQML